MASGQPNASSGCRARSTSSSCGRCRRWASACVRACGPPPAGIEHPLSLNQRTSRSPTRNASCASGASGVPLDLQDWDDQRRPKRRAAADEPRHCRPRGDARPPLARRQSRDRLDVGAPAIDAVPTPVAGSPSLPSRYRRGPLAWALTPHSPRPRALCPRAFYPRPLALRPSSPVLSSLWPCGPAALSPWPLGPLAPWCLAP